MWLTWKRHFLNKHFILDAVRKHQQEATLPKLKSQYHKSLVTRKPVCRMCDQGRLKLTCLATETSQRLEMLDLESIILSGQQEQRCWSDCTDAQADLHLCCSHMAKTGFLMTWLIKQSASIQKISANSDSRNDMHAEKCCAVELEEFGLSPMNRANCRHLWTYSFVQMSHIMRKPVYAICKQQRHRSACTFAQSDQHLCCSLPR